MTAASRTAAHYAPLAPGGADAHGDLPPDLIESKHAARIAGCHVSMIVRWVKAGKVRGWRRCGRIFVSRAEINALFQPIIPDAEKRKRRLLDAPLTPRQRRANDRWVDKVFRECGVRK